MKITRKIISAAAAVTIVAATSFGLAHGAKADGHAVKVGIILGFTGPIESLTPGMAASAELAMKEVTDSGKLLGGKELMAVRADSTCVDSAAATAADVARVLIVTGCALALVLAGPVLPL